MESFYLLTFVVVLNQNEQTLTAVTVCMFWLMGTMGVFNLPLQFVESLTKHNTAFARSLEVGLLGP